LIIGGDPSDIPDWVSANFYTKQVKISGTNIADYIGDFKAAVMIVMPKLTDKNTTYQAYDYAKERGIPILVMHYSWSLLITDARDRGLDWLAEAYPFKVYIPEEVLKRKAEIRTEKRLKRMGPATPRALMIQEKRKRRFAQAGIITEHAKHGRPKYIRRDPGSKCALCDTTISYLFRLHFDIPGQEQLSSFFPVGSTCIQIWLNSLPDSKEKDRIIKEVVPELEKADKEKRKVKRGKRGKIAKRAKKKAEPKKRPAKKPPAKKRKTKTKAKKKTAKKSTTPKRPKKIRRRVSKKKEGKKKKKPFIPKQRLLDFTSAESPDDED